MTKTFSRGYPSSAMNNIDKAFKEVQRYAVNYADTDALVSQLIIRMADWFEDIDPSYDEFFAKSNQNSLEMVYRALMRCSKDYAEGVSKNESSENDLHEKSDVNYTTSFTQTYPSGVYNVRYNYDAGLPDVSVMNTLVNRIHEGHEEYMKRRLREEN